VHLRSAKFIDVLFSKTEKHNFFVARRALLHLLTTITFCKPLGNEKKLLHYFIVIQINQCGLCQEKHFSKPIIKFLSESIH